MIEGTLDSQPTIGPIFPFRSFRGSLFLTTKGAKKAKYFNREGKENRKKHSQKNPLTSRQIFTKN